MEYKIDYKKKVNRYLNKAEVSLKEKKLWKATEFLAGAQRNSKKLSASELKEIGYKKRFEKIHKNLNN